MKDHYLIVAKTIIEQLGGNKFRAMTGTCNFLGGPDYVSFKFKGSKKANFCKIMLMPTDTYKMEFFKYSPKLGKFTPKAEFMDVYCDQLQDIFTHVTGLYTHL